MVVVMSCEIIRLEAERETYQVQSETDVNKYYIVKFDGTPVYCSCKDFEIQSKQNRNHICKHQWAIVLAENYGLVTTKRGTKLHNNVTEPSFDRCQMKVIEDSSSKSSSYQKASI